MKKLLLTLLALFAALPSFAFTSGNFEYTILDSKANTVSIKATSRTLTSAKITQTITYSSKTYTITALDNNAFASCTALESVTIPASVTSIGYNAFQNCSKLKSINIPESVTTIGNDAFYGCTVLASVNIPAGITHISAYMFGDCKELTSIVLPEGVASFGPAAFYGCSKLASINLPESLTTIPVNLFASCALLSSIDIPETVTSIGSGAFSSCKSLTHIKLPPMINEIGSGAFGYCYALESIELPDNLLTIGDGAFRYCRALTSLELPETLSYIGNSAFEGCTNLTSIRIPDSVTEDNFGSLVFSDCTSLPSYDILPKHFTSPGNRTFDGCSFTTIELPENMTKFSGFSNCNNITSITLPDRFTKIENDALNGCKNLTEVLLPGTLNYIGERAFANCVSLPSINIPDAVTFIGSEAFSGCVLLSTVQIPDSVTEENFGTGVFKRCNGLTTIDGILPEHFTSPGNETFSSCNGLISVSIPAHMTEVSGFSGCTSLKSVNMHPKITRIKNSAFRGCSALSEAIIPNSVSEIGEYAYYDCGLSKVSLPTDLTEIKPYSFACSSSSKSKLRTSLVLPPNITTIGQCAFQYNSMVKNLYLGPKVKTIGANAFNAADTIYCTAATPPTITSTSFPQYNVSVKLFVQGASTAYKAKTYWKSYTINNMTVPTGIVVEMDEPEMAPAYAPMRADSETQYSSTSHIYGQSGDSFHRTARITGSNVRIPYTFWKSDDPSKVYVDNDGNISVQEIPQFYKPVTLTAQTLYNNGPTHEITVDNYHMTGVDELFDEEGSEGLDPNAPARIYTIDGLPAGTSLNGLAPGIYIAVQGKYKVKINIR